jgi:serine/threonine protein kinase
MRRASIQQATPLLTRFALLRECESSNDLRCFIAQEHQFPDERPVQLRIFSAAEADKESELLAFLLEARAAAQLSHAHIAASTNPEQLGDIYFYVSQYPAGAVTLRNLLDRKGWLDVEESLRITKQIVEALQYAHQSAIWHLKLQPECLWIDQDHHLTVTDFGIPGSPSRPWAYQRRSQNCSLNYRCPEQLAGNLPDERSDLYGVGVLLYEMLTDVLPFNAQDEKQLRHKIALKKAPPVHLIRPDIPEPLSAMVAKLLAENPADRFQSAADLQATLNQFLETNWQAINLQTEDFSEVREPESAESKVENLPLPVASDDPDTAISTDDEQPVIFNEHFAVNAAALPLPAFASQALIHRQPASDEALTTTYAVTQEKPENIGSSVVERLKRWEFLPFTLMTLGVVLLTAVSVLAVKGDFRNLLNSSTEASQTELQTTSPVADKSGVPSRNPQAQSATDSSSGQSPSGEESTASADVSPSSADKIAGDGSGESAVAQSLSTEKRSTSRSLTTQVSRLRQQLRRINEAKVRDSQIRKRTAIAKPRQSRSSKRFHKYRFW